MSLRRSTPKKKIPAACNWAPKIELTGLQPLSVIRNGDLIGEISELIEMWYPIRRFLGRLWSSEVRTC